MTDSLVQVDYVRSCLPARLRQGIHHAVALGTNCSQYRASPLHQIHHNHSSQAGVVERDLVSSEAEFNITVQILGGDAIKTGVRLLKYNHHEKKISTGDLALFAVKSLLTGINDLSCDFQDQVWSLLLYFGCDLCWKRK